MWLRWLARLIVWLGVLYILINWLVTCIVVWFDVIGWLLNRLALVGWVFWSKWLFDCLFDSLTWLELIAWLIVWLFVWLSLCMYWLNACMIGWRSDSIWLFGRLINCLIDVLLFIDWLVPIDCLSSCLIVWYCLVSLFDWLIGWLFENDFVDWWIGGFTYWHELVDWLVDWLVLRLIDQLDVVDWLIRWNWFVILFVLLICWLVDWFGFVVWLVDWFVDWFMVWLIDWLVCLVEWLILYLVDWFDWLIILFVWSGLVWFDCLIVWFGMDWLI